MKSVEENKRNRREVKVKMDFLMGVFQREFIGSQCLPDCKYV